MSNLPPSGEIPRGAIRFNTDSNKPELWDGSQWAEFQLSTPNLGRSVDTQPGARGVFGRQYTPSILSKIEYLNISTYSNVNKKYSTKKKINFNYSLIDIKLEKYTDDSELNTNYNNYTNYKEYYN